MKPTAYVEVHYGDDGRADSYHRPHQRDPEHSGPLMMPVKDARLFAVPCPVCFPPERTAA